MSRFALKSYCNRLDSRSPFPVIGHITNISGLILEGHCPEVAIGGILQVTSLDGKHTTDAEVIGFRDDRALLMPIGELRGIGKGSEVRFLKDVASINIGPELIGRVINPLMQPLDDGPAIDCEEEYSIYSNPINPLKRGRIETVLDLGVRAVNGLLTIGRGQRIGIMSGSGVGKSMLLGMMARNTNADINVVALIGERGREVREFLERDLGPEGLKRSVVVIATGDSSALIRMRCAYVAITISEYFRRQGADVLLMMDSLTRFSMSQREIGLSAGEPPTTKGYPPSVFTTLPKLLERAGNLQAGGSVTGIYTVLIEQDDLNDPIGDAVRSIVDGHLFLTRKLASRSHYPAIDVGNSISRVMTEIVSQQHNTIANKIKSIIATYAEAEDLINIGAYVKGSNTQIDEAIQYIQPIREFLRQDFKQAASFDDSLRAMASIFQRPQGAPPKGGR